MILKYAFALLAVGGLGSYLSYLLVRPEIRQYKAWLKAMDAIQPKPHHTAVRGRTDNYEAGEGRVRVP